MPTLAKADDAAAAIVAELGVLEAMKLQKLLYYCQAWHLAVFDRKLFADEVQAWRQGPVVDAVWTHHRGLRQVNAWQWGDPACLDENARAIVSLVCAAYGGLSGDDLSALTHSEGPWQEARAGLPDSAPSRAPISDHSMTDFYRHRQLGGRTAADLSAGGVFLTRGPISPGERLDHRLTVEKLRHALAQSEPSAHPDQGDLLGRGQFEQPTDEARSIVAALRSRREARRDDISTG